MNVFLKHDEIVKIIQWISWNLSNLNKFVTKSRNKIKASFPVVHPLFALQWRGNDRDLIAWSCGEAMVGTWSPEAVERQW